MQVQISNIDLFNIVHYLFEDRMTMLSPRIDTLGVMGYKYKGVVLWKSHLGISLVSSLECQCTRLTINVVGMHLDWDIFA
jgi:hypothetical protein